MKQKAHKLDKLGIGLFLGILIPVVTFFAYYLIKFSDIGFSDYLASMHHYKLLFKILSLCVLADLPVFYIFIQLKFWKTSRGIVFACFIFAFMVLGYRIFN